MVKIIRVKKVEVVVGKGKAWEFKRFFKEKDIKKVRKHYEEYGDTVKKTGKVKYVKRIGRG